MGYVVTREKYPRGTAISWHGHPGRVRTTGTLPVPSRQDREISCPAKHVQHGPGDGGRDFSKSSDSSDLTLIQPTKFLFPKVGKTLASRHRHQYNSKFVNCRN